MLRVIKSRRYADSEVQSGMDDIQTRWQDGLALGVFHNGVLFEGQSVAAATTLRLFHGLGRVPKFVAKMMADANVEIWVKPDVDPTRYVSINASGTAKVNVLVA